MIRYVIPAAVAAIALGAPAVQAQTTMPQPTTLTTAPAVTNTSAPADAAITGQPQPGPGEFAAPMPAPYPMPGFTPRTVWIPGGYSWDPNRNTYVWNDGQYVEAPRENAQWIPGHWAQTPTAWIWLGGRWN